MELSIKFLAALWIFGLLLAGVALVLAWGARKAAQGAQRTADSALGAVNHIGNMQSRSGSPDPVYPAVKQSEIRAVNEALEGLRRELGELKTRVSAQASRRAPDPLYSGPGDGTIMAAGAQDLDLLPAAEASSHGAPAAGTPVELRDGDVVASRSLAAPGSLVTDGSREVARLYLNEDVELTHVAFDQWSVFFDFRGGRPYTRYATREPALVYWNDAAGRGKLKDKGIAEPRA